MERTTCRPAAASSWPFATAALLGPLEIPVRVARLAVAAHVLGLAAVLVKIVVFVSVMMLFAISMRLGMSGLTVFTGEVRTAEMAGMPRLPFREGQRCEAEQGNSSSERISLCSG